MIVSKREIGGLWNVGERILAKYHEGAESFLVDLEGYYFDVGRQTIMNQIALEVMSCGDKVLLVTRGFSELFCDRVIRPPFDQNSVRGYRGYILIIDQLSIEEFDRMELSKSGLRIFGFLKGGANE